MPTGDHWEYASSVQVLFGTGRIDELPVIVRGRRALLVTTPGWTRRGLTDRVRTLVGLEQVIVLDTVRPNPDLADVDQAYRRLSAEPIQVVIGLGGGSVLDTTFLMFLTPVVYPVPDTGSLAAVMAANPLTGLITASRDMVFTGHLTDLAGFSWWSTLAVAFFLFSWRVFHLVEPRIAERV